MCRRALTAARAGAAVFLWRRLAGGKRGDYLAFGQAFASAGIVTVVADYRLYPQVKYPAFVEDAAGALAWLHAHVAALWRRSGAHLCQRPFGGRL